MDLYNSLDELRKFINDDTNHCSTSSHFAYIAKLKKVQRFKIPADLFNDHGLSDMLEENNKKLVILLDGLVLLNKLNSALYFAFLLARFHAIEIKDDDFYYGYIKFFRSHTFANTKLINIFKSHRNYKHVDTLECYAIRSKSSEELSKQILECKDFNNRLEKQRSFKFYLGGMLPASDINLFRGGECMILGTLDGRASDCRIIVNKVKDSEEMGVITGEMGVITGFINNRDSPYVSPATSQKKGTFFITVTLVVGIGLRSFHVDFVAFRKDFL